MHLNCCEMGLLGHASPSFRWCLRCIALRLSVHVWLFRYAEVLVKHQCQHALGMAPPN